MYFPFIITMKKIYKIYSPQNFFKGINNNNNQYNESK